MRAGPSQVWLDRHIATTHRPDPGTLLAPMLVLVVALASPLLVPLPAVAVLVAAALGWVVRRATRSGGGAPTG